MNHNYIVMISELLSEAGLSFERLQSFCLVAEAGGVTKAAKGDPARQSLYSRQIKELEEFFGAELIRRAGRGVSLTAAGQKLYGLSREAFTSLSDFKAECRSLPFEVIIGSGESIIRWLLLPKLEAIQKALPRARVQFLNLTTNEIVRRLGEGTLDFGIVRSDSVGSQIKSKPLGTLRYSLFVPQNLGIDLSGLRNLKSLKDVPVATLEGDGHFRQELAKIEQKNGVRLNVEVECSSFPLVAMVVHSGKAAAILPSIAGSELKSSTVREMKLPSLDGLGRKLCLAWSPRVLRIRTALNRACDVLAREIAL